MAARKRRLYPYPGTRPARVADVRGRGNPRASRNPVARIFYRCFQPRGWEGGNEEEKMEEKKTIIFFSSIFFSSAPLAVTHTRIIPAELGYRPREAQPSNREATTMIKWLGTILAVAMILVVLVDAFEVVLLPRRIRHGFRLARIFFRASWAIGRTAAGLLPAGRWRTGFLSTFGPLCLFALLAVWAVGLIVGFALLHWSLGIALSDKAAGFGTYLYFSGTTLFTLGYGDLAATHGAGRALSVVEAGLGFVFLAVIVSYLPVLYQAFSRREVGVALLDARAGSPPTAAELLRRLAGGRNPAAVGSLLFEWERWAAELLESHLSFPVLSYYRSQHENQSWVGALTAILDTSALLIAAVDGPDGYQARLTFAMARHAAVDLVAIFQLPLRPPEPDRLSAAQFDRLRESLRAAGLTMRDDSAAVAGLAQLRGLYEPFVNALAAFFHFALPPFQPDKPPVDNWQTSPWMPRSPGFGHLSPAGAKDDHFD